MYDCICSAPVLEYSRLIMVYVLIGAAIGATYYYFQLKADKRDKDVFNSVWVGLLWPIVAPY